VDRSCQNFEQISGSLEKEGLQLYDAHSEFQEKSIGTCHSDLQLPLNRENDRLMRHDIDIIHAMHCNTLANDNRQSSVEVICCTCRDHLLITTPDLVTVRLSF
jgi:hypothetical protein